LHLAAGKSIDSIRAAVFPEIGKRVRSGGTNEFEIQQWLMGAFRERISGLRIERTIDLSCLAGNGARFETPENIESNRSSSRSFLVFIEA